MNPFASISRFGSLPICWTHFSCLHDKRYCWGGSWGRTQKRFCPRGYFQKFLRNFQPPTAGVLEGLGFGFNTTAALVTRGCSEMTRLAIKMGGRPTTLSGSVFLCLFVSVHLRNFFFFLFVYKQIQVEWHWRPHVDLLWEFVPKSYCRETNWTRRNGRTNFIVDERGSRRWEKFFFFFVVLEKNNNNKFLK